MRRVFFRNLTPLVKFLGMFFIEEGGQALAYRMADESDVRRF